MGLIARHLEANGIPTVIAGSALDITEHCGVPRFAFTDFPLGNPMGKPNDRAMQLAITRLALSLFHASDEPRTSAQTRFAWSDSDAWRSVYSRVDDTNREVLKLVGEERRRTRAELPKRTA